MRSSQGDLSQGKRQTVVSVGEWINNISENLHPTTLLPEQRTTHQVGWLKGTGSDHYLYSFATSFY